MPRSLATWLPALLPQRTRQLVGGLPPCIQPRCMPHPRPWLAYPLQWRRRQPALGRARSPHLHTAPGTEMKQAYSIAQPPLPARASLACTRVALRCSLRLTHTVVCSLPHGTRPLAMTNRTPSTCALSALAGHRLSPPPLGAFLGVVVPRAAPRCFLSSCFLWALVHRPAHGVPQALLSLRVRGLHASLY